MTPWAYRGKSIIKRRKEAPLSKLNLKGLEGLKMVSTVANVHVRWGWGWNWVSMIERKFVLISSRIQQIGNMSHLEQ